MSRNATGEWNSREDEQEVDKMHDKLPSQIEAPQPKHGWGLHHRGRSWMQLSWPLDDHIR